MSDLIYYGLIAVAMTVAVSLVAAWLIDRAARATDEYWDA